MGDNKPTAKKDFERAALYAGSFNPVTKGHLHVIGHAAKMSDRLVVGVGSNPSKSPLFSGAERVEMIRRDIQAALQPELDAAGNPCKIEVVEYQGATTDLMQKEGISLFFRGVRGVSDFNDEDTLALANADLFNDGNFKTNLNDQFTQALIYTTDPELRKVSSSVARELCALGKDDALLRYISPEVRLELIQRMEQKGLRPGSDKKYRIATADEIKSLETKWAELTKDSDPKVSRAIYIDLMTRYSEAHRMYHNTGHLAELFEYFEKNEDKLRDPQSVALALFFHDVIYDVGAGDNEERSAQYAAEKMKLLGFSDREIGDVAALVVMTKDHKCPAGDNDAALMLDMDTAVVGLALKDYRRYASAIAAEYGSLYSAADFNKGRLERFVTPWLAKDRHFITDAFQSKYGRRAKLNLQDEKRSLQSSIESAPPSLSIS